MNIFIDFASCFFYFLLRNNELNIRIILYNQMIIISDFSVHNNSIDILIKKFTGFFHSKKDGTNQFHLYTNKLLFFLHFYWWYYTNKAKRFIAVVTKLMQITTTYKKCIIWFNIIFILFYLNNTSPMKN